jgi:hypothetical protein
MQSYWGIMLILLAAPRPLSSVFQEGFFHSLNSQGSNLIIGNAVWCRRDSSPAKYCRNPVTTMCVKITRFFFVTCNIIAHINPELRDNNNNIVVRRAELRDLYFGDYCSTFWYFRDTSLGGCCVIIHCDFEVLVMMTYTTVLYCTVPFNEWVPK